MLKKILNKIQRLEQQKQIKVDKQSQIQSEIDEIDVKPYCNKCNDTLEVNGKMCSCLKSEISKILIK